MSRVLRTIPVVCLLLLSGCDDKPEQAGMSPAKQKYLLCALERERSLMPDIWPHMSADLREAAIISWCGYPPL